MPRVQSRPCAAPGCGQGIPVTRLMCRPHWRSLPEALRDAITQSFRFGDRDAYADNLRRADRLFAGERDGGCRPVSGPDDRDSRSARYRAA